jgi:hypothetical protein
MNADPDFTVDLRRPPEDRWRLTPTQRRQARELLAMYKADLAFGPDVGEFLTATVKDLVRPEHWQEMDALSRSLELPVADVVLCNIYYDAL